MKQFRLFLTLGVALLIAATSCQQAPFLTMNGPKSFNFSKEGGSQSITFSTNKDWTVRSSESWCKVSPASGSAAEGNVTVTVTVDKNTSYDPRICTLTVKVEEITETVSVSQDMGLGLIVSPTTLNLTNAAQDFEIEVQKNVSYTVNMDDIAKTFITYNGTKGLSSEKASFSIAANDTYDDREGVITFQQTGGDLVQTVTVKQSQTNGLFITTPEYDLSNEAHTLTVEVKANVEFEVTSQADWIKYASTSTKALKPSQITLEVAANETYDHREGQVEVKQKGGELTGIITIKQAESYGLFVSPESVEISKDAQEVEVAVQYNVDFDVIIPEDAKGTMITMVKSDDEGETKALETRKYRIGVSGNTDFSDRKTTITFKQKNGPLCGTVEIRQAQMEGLFFEKDEIEIDAIGGNVDIGVNSNIDYTYSLSDGSEEWLEPADAPSTKSLLPSTISLVAKPNISKKPREATITIQNGELKALCTITQKPASFINLSEGETANCYIIPESGFYSFDATVIGNGERGIIKGAGFHTENPIINPKSAKVLWVDNQALNPIIKFEEGEVLLFVDNSKGNALITVYSDYENRGEILWSWHLWFTDQPLDVTVINYEGLSITVMDRNVGAISASPDDFDNSCGLMYQWGRKDPFPYSMTAFTDGSIFSFDMKAPNSTEATISKIIQFPTTYFCHSSMDQGYCYFSNTMNDALWGNPNWREYGYVIDMTSTEEYKYNPNSLKTIYDPSPKGYKVPSPGVFSNFNNEEIGYWEGQEYVKFSDGQKGGWKKGYELYATSTETIWFPAAGYLWRTDKQFGRGNYAIYWYSAMTGTFHFAKTNFWHYCSDFFDTGASVRCVKE